MNGADSEARRTLPLPPLVVILGPTASGNPISASRWPRSWAARFWFATRPSSTAISISARPRSPSPSSTVSRTIWSISSSLPRNSSLRGTTRVAPCAVLGDLRLRQKLPMLTAGTGLYLRALLVGLADAPARSEELRDRLRRRESERSESAGRSGPEHLHRLLARVDPQTAARIAPRDRQKTTRGRSKCAY